MREIEVKAHLKEEKNVVQRLGAVGAVFSETEKQVDKVYVKTQGDLSVYLSNDHFVRIREKSDGRKIFTVKVPKASREHLAKLEHETEIEDSSEMEQCLFLMGYKLASTVVKERRTSKVNDYEICIDEVEGLGSFIEVEKMVENSGPDDAHVLEELRTFLFDLGVLPEDEVRKGYDILIIEKFAKQ